MSALQVRTDLALGGRWTSLRAGEREWLWSNPAVSLAERAVVRSNMPFVDAGGGEECFPSVTGDPAHGHDHGDVWCRPWVGDPADAAARTRSGLTLRRRLTDRGGVVRAEYEITDSEEGPVAGTGFVHAVHLLWDVSTAAILRVPGTPEVAVQDHPRPGEITRGTWPDPVGARLDLLGPDDGSATCAVVASDVVEILDGDHAINLRWGSRPGIPTSFVLWRNLGGWPAGNPYRSIGIEPMIGATTGLAGADPGDLAHLGDTGTLSWWLEIAATPLGDETDPR